jgi:RNA polymerase sigma-70 factor, ECF subfamily
MTMPMTDDPVTQLQRAPHDPVALAALVACHQAGLVDWLERVMRNRDLADEAVQETWLVISRGSWRFAAQSEDAAGDVRAWLRQVALRAAFRLRAGQLRQGEVLAQVARDQQKVSSPTPLEQLAESDQRAVVWAAIAELPPMMRNALELRFRNGLDFAAIGQAQQCTALTARVRTWRALGTLRRQLLLLGLSLVPATLTTLLAAEAGGAFASTTEGGGVIGSTGVRLPTIPLVAGLGLSRWLIAGGVLAPALLVAIWNGVMGEEPPNPPAIDQGSSTPTLAVVATVSKAPPRQLLRAQLTDGLPQHVSALSTDIDRPQIRVDVQIIHDFGGHLSYPGDRVTVLTPGQLAELSHGLTAPSEELSSPSIVLASEQSAVMTMGSERAFLTGYAVDEDGEIAPVMERFLEGTISSVTARMGADGACIVMATVIQREVMAQEQRSVAIAGQLAKYPGGDPWNELAFRESRTIALPDGGMVVPPGASLLLPVTGSVVKRLSPSGISTVADYPSGSDSWWAVITPAVLPADDRDPEPPQPEARG